MCLPSQSKEHLAAVNYLNKVQGPRLLKVDERGGSGVGHGWIHLSSRESGQEGPLDTVG